MNHQLINIALIYFISAVTASSIVVFIFKMKFFGNFWGAIVLALIGSFFGGAVGSLFPLVFNRVFQTFLPSIIGAFIFLSLFQWISIVKEY